jgi:uncharacterized protein (TIGR03437 family)
MCSYIATEVLLNKFRFFMIAPLLAIAFVAPAAFAQTPVNISIISGNGQISCPECTQQGYGVQSFAPLYIKVTDANGNPVSGAQVNWSVVLGQGTFSSSGAQTAQSTTDVNGSANVLYLLPLQSFSGSAIDPYVANTISASITSGASVTFYETQAFVSTTSGNVNAPVFVAVYDYTPGSTPPCGNCINPGDTLTGTAGSTSTDQFQVQVYVPGSGNGVPNVSLRLIPNQTSPSISCATGPGADPGSVLTNSNGIAVCTPILGSTTGTGSFYFIVGGVTANYSPSAAPIFFFNSGNYNLVVTPGVPGMISIASGNNQGANPGQALALPLQAIVADASGNPLSGQQVTWTVSPSGAATLSNTTTTSGSNGQVQTNVTLANTAAGTIQIKAALTSNPSIATTFTVTANIQVSGLQIVSGNSQTAIIGSTFGLPLVVQLATSNGTSVANIPVTFSISGPGTLSTQSTTTNSLGQAQVNVTAGAVTGAINVTAAAGGFSQTFSLTVIPVGPTLSSSSFYNGADFQPGSISPCSIATIIAPGVASTIQGAVAFDGVGALPYLLATDAVTIGGAQAPLYNVANINGQQQVTFQVPCSVTPGTNAVTVNVGGGSGSANVTVLPASPGLFNTQVSSTTSIPVLERPDGSFVSPANPGRRGETLIAYVTGLGPTIPAVATNALPVPGSTATVQGTVIVGVNGGGASLISASLTPDIVGVYEVAFVVPSSVPSGINTDFSIGVLPQGTSKVYYSTLGYFPVQ